MPGRELEVKAQLRDEITGKLNTIRDSVRSFTKTSNDMLKPWVQMQQTFMRWARVAAIPTAAFFVMKKAMNDTWREMNELDRQAIKLGTTTEELSKKIYGFNIATPEARISQGFFAKLGQELKSDLQFWKSAFTDSVGGIISSSRAAQLSGEIEHFQAQRLGRPLTYDERMNIAQHTRSLAQKQLLSESESVKKNSPAALAASEEVVNKINQLTLSNYEFKKKIFDQEISLYRLTGVEEGRLMEYKAAFEKNSEREKFVEIKKLQAQSLQAKGETLAAQDLMDEGALEEFKRKWGEDGEAVEAFKAAQEAMKREKTPFIQMAKNIGAAMSDALGNIFVDGITNKFKSAREIFSDFGRSILKMLADLAAQYLISSTLGSIWSPFNILGLSRKHSGGIIRAHSGLAVDEVPIIAQSGEGVLSRRGMSALGRSNFDRLNHGESIGGGNVNIQPVLVIHAWDASDIMRHQKEIEGMMVNSIVRNSSVREVIKKYG